MDPKAFPWVNAYPLVELAINAEGLTSPAFADATFPINVGFHCYSGPHCARTRYHKSVEVIYIYAGRTTIQVQERSLRVKHGELIVLGPNLFHRILNNPKIEVRIVSLNFSPDLIRGSEPSADAELYLLPFLCQDSSFPYVVPASIPLPSSVLRLMLEIHRSLPARSDLDKLAVKTRAKMLLLSLLDHYKEYLDKRRILDRRERDIRRLRPVFQFLEHHHGQRIAVADAARLCAMSASHFMKFFKTVTAETFLAYVNHFKIARAQTLLATTDEAVGVISEMLAFCSQSHFGKVFRDRVGITPLAYRRRFGRAPGSEAP